MNKQPRGFFEFEDSTGTVIRGRFCTWSINRFCEKMGIKNVTEYFESITTGLSFSAVAESLLCAVEYTFKGQECKYTLDDAFDWIDDIGGIAKVNELLAGSMPEAEDEGQKKSKKSR